MKLSVIVPVYNVEKYLKDCLDSLLDQGLEDSDYEIICINDGSTDSSTQILREYAKKHKNIIVIDKENAGVSAARNDGLNIAKGKYIAFCDSDDCIRTGAYKQIIPFMEKNSIRIAFTRGFAHIPETYSYKREESFKLNIAVLPNSNYTTTSPCSLIIDKTLIDADKITFKKGMKYGEDTLFAARIYAESIKSDAKGAAVNSKIYMYRARESSAMHTMDNNAHFEDMYTMGKEYIKIKNSNSNSIIVNNFTQRIDSVVTTLLYDNLRIKKYKPKNLFEMLKKDGLYPCNIPLWSIKKGSTKIKLLNLFKCTMLFKPLYAIYFAIIKIK